MSHSKINMTSSEKVQVDEKTLAAIDRGLQDANSGRTVSLDDLRKMISNWRTSDTQGKQP